MNLKVELRKKINKPIVFFFAGLCYWTEEESKMVLVQNFCTFFQILIIGIVLLTLYSIDTHFEASTTDSF